MKKIILALIAILTFTCVTPLLAQDFDKGYAAYMIGDYATAVKEWKPLAEQGDATAQHSLGWMYENGRSIVQDDVRSHMWYNIAAAGGEDEAGERQDKVAAKMTSEEVLKVQSVARECMDSNYKNCGF